MSTNKKVPKSSAGFSCLVCDYNSVRESQFNRHLLTRKHKILTNTNKKFQKVPDDKSYQCVCGHSYKFASSLCFHRKKCLMVLSPPNDDEGLSLSVTPKDNTISNDVVIKLIKQNEKLQEQLISLSREKNVVNNIVNNTNNFNLNLFLNEKCKDALNINDFIESLKITLEDLDFSNKNGMVQGISNLMIKGLKELDIYKRPIHCTDAKRDIIYIKDKEKWEKDDNHSKIKNTITKVANKERNSLYLWVEKNPDWFDSEATQIEYLTMMRNICEPVEDFEKNEKKIIKNIGREVTLDKCAI